MRLVSKAKVYDLEQLRYTGMPYFPTQAPGFLYFLHRRHSDLQGDSNKRKGGLTGVSGFITSADHTSTHVDAFCHMAYDGKLYGGVEVTNEIETRTGYKKRGAEELPLLILPGVLLDIPKTKGVDILPEGYEITREEIESSCSEENVEIRKGEAVLVRTGYGKLWTDSSRFLRAAGVSRDGNQLFADSGVRVIGADNLGVDPSVPPAPGKERSHYAHEYCLSQKGIYLLEILNLEGLSADMCYKFLLVCLPLKLQGATAGWARPVALRM